MCVLTQIRWGDWVWVCVWSQALWDCRRLRSQAWMQCLTHEHRLTQTLHTHVQNNTHTPTCTHIIIKCIPALTRAHTVKQTQTDETQGHPADHHDQCESCVFSDLICLANIHLFCPINNTEQHVFMTLPLLTQFISSSSKLIPSSLSFFVFQWLCFCNTFFLSHTHHTPLIILFVCIGTLKTILWYLEAYGSRKFWEKRNLMSHFRNKYVCLELWVKIVDTPLL